MLKFFLAAYDNENKDVCISEEVQEDTTNTVLHVVHYFASIKECQFAIYELKIKFPIEPFLFILEPVHLITVLSYAIVYYYNYQCFFLGKLG